MATQIAVVDDRDPLIQYGGSWVRGGVWLEFGSTTMFSVTAGSTASFTFVGTSITVYGTVAAKNLNPQASWSFVIDGSITGTYTPPNNMTSDIHHEALWTSPASSLNNGSHELVITQSAAASDGVLYLDYILYTTTSANVSAYFIDDRDPQIKYTPAWRQFGSDLDFQHTSQATTNVGDSLSLTFEGKSIQLFGSVTSATEKASMAIDGGPATIWIPPADAKQTNNLIYSSGGLTPGNHTLVITAMNDQPVWADYFLVTPNPPGTVISSSPSSAGSPSNTAPPSHKSTPVGAIVGPIVGVLALVALVAAIFLCRRRRRQQEEYEGLLMSNDIAPAPSISGYAAAGAAGPPPVLSRGYSSSLVPFATPGEPGPSSVVVNSGILRSLHSDPDPPFATSSNPQLASTSYPVVSSSGSATSSARPNSGQELPPHYFE
ncbi:hypothetical protein MVEN_01632900 [Mycena venus]|uniref:Transmembrane protein n=1 Tax=Mycena venus TaxID=2733690 RepID=A0A8H6XQL8_9AGAR|nr:hypothetical protein MVEN_01632900 [Mycena venus]